MFFSGAIRRSSSTASEPERRSAGAPCRPDTRRNVDEPLAAVRPHDHDQLLLPVAPDHVAREDAELLHRQPVEDVLDVLGVDVLPARGHDHVLPAAEEAQVPGRLEPSEVAALFPKTLATYLLPPPGTTFGKSLEARPKPEWKDVGNGVRFWQAPWDPPADFASKP